MDVVRNIIGNGKKLGGRNDWDGDGVKNKKDCQPRNTMRQDNIIRSPTKKGAISFFREQGLDANNSNVETVAPPPGDDVGGVFRYHPYKK